ncbi:phage virion morphogenesis protein [Escherichia coli]|nr:phage virion morphogenesis protein [Escherichia coli]
MPAGAGTALTQQQNIRMQRNPRWQVMSRDCNSTQQKGAQTSDVYKAAHHKIPENCRRADSASVQFEGKVQRIARVHHYGLRDRISRRGPEVRYAERRLLGVNDDVETVIQDALLNWLQR